MKIRDATDGVDMGSLEGMWQRKVSGRSVVRGGQVLGAG